MKVIITGATGFIGSALCFELLALGHEVTAIVRPNSKNISRLSNKVKYVVLSLDNISKLSGDYDVFYHLAWNGAVGYDRENFELQYSNIYYMSEAIKTAVRCGCKTFIGAGSQAEYGVVNGTCTEETKTNPFMMYGAAKLSAYYMCSLLSKQLNINFVWPRIYSVYGVGENFGTVMSYAVRSLIKGEKLELTDCKNVWDFLYITDCAKALCKFIAGEFSGIYNISYGKPRILRDFIEEARDIINSDCELVFNAKLSDPNRTYWLNPDISKLTKDTGFTPKVKFSEGVKLMYSWLSSDLFI